MDICIDDAHEYIYIYIHIHGYFPQVPKQYEAIDLEQLKEETMLPKSTTWIV